MLIFLVASLLLALIIVIFILQNTSLVTVNFIMWQYEGPLALILFLTFIIGIIISLLVVIPLFLGRREKKLKKLPPEV